MNKEQALQNVIDNPMSSEAWQALGKSCGWNWTDEALKDPIGEAMPEFNSIHIYHALKFHEINLTQGWDKAVEWLEGLID